MTGFLGVPVRIGEEIFGNLYLTERSQEPGSSPRTMNSWRWGEPIYPDTATSLMTKLIRADEQLPHARPHDLRHLHATTSRPVTPCRSVSTLEILIAADSSSFSARCFSRVRSSVRSRR
jgi:hypothetical protein